MVIKMTPWEAVQGIYQFLSCTSQGLDNGLCSRRTRHIDKLSQHRPFIMAKKLQIKKNICARDCCVLTGGHSGRVLIFHGQTDS